jgi:hypothetical protein
MMGKVVVPKVITKKIYQMRAIKRLDPPLAHVNFLDGCTISLIPVCAIHELNPLLVLMLNEGPLPFTSVANGIEVPSNQPGDIHNISYIFKFIPKDCPWVVTSRAINTSKGPKKAIRLRFEEYSNRIEA